MCFGHGRAPANRTVFNRSMNVVSMCATMFEQRSLKLDLIALGLLALVIFLTLCLATYNPADSTPGLIRPLDQLYQADVLVYPASGHVSNACGKWGALVSDLLLTGVGLGSYYLLVSLVIVDVLLLMRKDISAPLLRFIGWTVSLLGLITTFSMIAPGISPGPVVGSGGYLGALTAAVLHTHFASIGGVILSVSFLLGGLLLCTDYVLFSLGANAARVTGSQLARAGRKLQRPEKAGNDAAAVKADNDEWEEEEIDGADETGEEDEIDEEGIMKVRISGRRAAEIVEAEEEDEYEDAVADEDEPDESESAEDADECEDEEYEEGEYEEEDQPAVADKKRTSLAVAGEKSSKRPSSGFRSRVADALRITKPVEKSREEVMDELEAAAAADSGEVRNYELPPLDLLLEGEAFSYDQQEKEVRRKARILEKTFANFGFQVKVVEVETGPVIAQYEVELEAGLRLSRITGLANDLAIGLRVPSVRIVAPIPGKNTVGIEVPNQQRQIVRLRSVMEETNGKTSKMRIPLFLGKDVSGKALAVDLSTLPHLLIAGRTGTGKSVCLNAIISSILMTRRPDEVRMLMIDPKMVELSCYKTLPHLMHPVVTDMRKAEAILAWAVEKMEERYALLARAGVRHVSMYNQLGKEELIKRLKPENQEEKRAIPRHLPFIIVVADEIADLMMTSGKEVEQHIIRLAQKSRAVGIHLILATQKPTVDVITGLIKSNLPARIAFQVASRTDSRVVLDEMGADKLLGDGDMLFLWPGTSTLLRGQGTYMSDDEIDSVVDFVSTGEQHFVKELVHMKVDDASADLAAKLPPRDDLYETAVDIVVGEGRGSVSLLQRALGIGYGRAARLIDFMAEDGIVGAYAGSQAREVLITDEQWRAMQYDSGEPPVATVPALPHKRTVSIEERQAVDEFDDDTYEDEDAAAVFDDDEEDEDEESEKDEETADEPSDDEDVYEEEDEVEEDEDEEDEYEEEEEDEVEDEAAEYEGELAEDESAEEEEYESDEHEEEEYEEEEYEEEEYEEEEDDAAAEDGEKEKLDEEEAEFNDEEPDDGQSQVIDDVDRQARYVAGRRRVSRRRRA